MGPTRSSTSSSSATSPRAVCSRYRTGSPSRAAGRAGSGPRGGGALFSGLTDTSPREGWGGGWAATAYSFDQRGSARLPARERERLLLDNLATYVGDDARKPLLTLERNWTGAVRVDAPFVDDV